MRQSPILGVAAALAGCALLVALAGGPGRTQAARAAQDPPAPAATVPATINRAPLTFRHLSLGTGGDAPELCLHFSAPMRPQAGTRYEDWVTVAPQSAVALTARGDALCVGGLAYGNQYTLTLHRGLPASNGARLVADEVVPASLGDRAALVDISGDGFILPSKVAHGLTIQTVNVRRVRIHVLRVSDRLIPAETRSTQHDQVDFKDTGIWAYAMRNLLLDTAVPVWSGTMDVAEDHNRTVQTAFPLARVIKPGECGAYLVIAEDAARALPESAFDPAKNNDENWFEDEGVRNKASHWVIATDIALTSYTGTDGLQVAARSLATALPLPGVTLSLLSTGQDMLGQAVTGADGMAHFPAGLLRGRNAAAANTVVAHGAQGDWTLMQLNRPAFDFSDRGVTGRPSPAPLQAFLYTDRGIYRPGHSVEVMALLRDRVGDAVDAPLTLVLRRPNGLEAKRWTLPKQPAAGFHQTVVLSDTAARGSWSVEALADPEGAPVGRTTFEVQDYVPQQLKVTLAPVSAPVAPDGKVPISLAGDFLYGAPAAGLRGQADLRVTRDAAPIPDAKGWQFGLVDETVDDKTKTVDLPLSDAAGHSTADAVPDLPEGVRSPLKLVVTAGLLDPSGRQVSDTVEVKLPGKPLLIGLRAGDTGAGFDQPAHLLIAAFDAKTGAMVARSGLIWHVVDEQRLFDWFENDGRWHWHYRTEDRAVADGLVDTQDGKPAVLTRQDGWGQYRLVVEDPASGAIASMRYNHGWMQTAGDVEQPDKIAVSTDRAAIAEGQTAHIHIAAPFAGHATVLVANDRILASRELAVPKGGVDVPVTAGADWGAGAYALVTLYRPLNEGGAHEPVRAVGTVWIGMDAAPRTLAVNIPVPDRVLPRGDVVVPLHIGNLAGGQKAFVTLAAVDEGILQLTRFATPDPVGFLFGKRALGVAMRDDYAKLLDGSADPGQIQGGDEGIGGPGLPVVSTRTVALFRGPITVDAHGDAAVTLRMPDFEGQLRLMAVAYTDHAAGAAARTLIVRDPVVADVAMPRFLADGDTAALAVSLNNTDGTDGEYRLHVSVAGAAGLDGAGDFTAALKPGAQLRRSVQLVAKSAGIAAIDADLSGPHGLHVHRAWQLAVRGAHAPMTVQQTAWQLPGEVFHADPALLAPFVPGTAAVSVGYSRVAGIDVPGLLQSLDTYPYGCTEQLSSSAFPLLYYADAKLHAAMPDAGAVRARVQNAIDSILDRQDDTGEFGLWRVGDEEASTWLNVYALDFLMHAREAGYDVPDSAIQRAALWLRGAADGQTRRDFEGIYAEGPAVTRPYAAYVLARLGRVDLAGLRRVHDMLTELPGSGPARVAWHADTDTILEPLALGQMAGAFALTGDHWRAADTFRKAIDNLGYPVWPGWWFTWSYATPARDWAGLVAIAAETNQMDALGTLLDRHTPELLAIDRLNTQEKASLLSAAHALSASRGTIGLSVNGAALASGAQPDFALDEGALARGFTVTSTDTRPVWRSLTVSGNPREAGPALSAGYTIDRHYFAMAGKTLDPAHLHQNDRLVVVLDGGVVDRLEAHRTVIVDMLPAGWEIEAPVHDETEFGFIGPLSHTRVKEARDDRFVAALDFGDDLRHGYRSFEDNEADDAKPHLEDWQFRVAYVARAVTPGHFTRPEATVQDMYRPAVMARTEAGVTDVAVK